MGVLLQDIRYAFRTLLKRPGFTIPAVLAMALGIGTITQVFSVVNRVLIEPLPFNQPDELVAVWGSNKKLNLPRMGFSGADFLDLKAQNRVLQEVAAINFWGVNLTGGGEPERVQGFQVSASLFPTLGVKPALGRVFGEEEDRPGNDRVVVLSHGLWSRRFGSNPGIVGQTVQLNNNAYTVVGVMGPDFQYPRRSAELWTPLALDAKQQKDRTSRFLLLVGRLKPNVTIEQAQSDLNSFFTRLQEQFPDTNAGYSIWMVPLKEMIIGPARQDLLITMAAAIFVLVIACANVAGMLLARGASRRKELSIRLALGATRLRLIQQLLTESVVLALVGAFFGLVVAYWGSRLHAASIPDFIAETNPGIKDVHINGTVLLFTLLISILTGALFGVLPALILSKANLNVTLKEGGRSSSGSTRHRTHNVLVVAEIAVALVLLISAGLLVRSYMRLQEVNPGFDSANTLVVDVSPLQSRYGDGAKVATLYRQILERVKALPGVKDAGAISHLPLGGGGMSRTLVVEGRPAPPPGEEPYTNYRVVSPKYFAAQGLRLSQGRDFTDQDIDGVPCAVVSESLARQFWPKEEALGKRFTVEGETTPRQVVGVVGDVNDWDLANKSNMYVYVPYLLQKPRLPMTLVVRTNSSDPTSLAGPVRAQVMAVDPDQPVYNVRTMDKVIGDTRWPQKINMGSLGVLAIISLVLAAIGIYGLISYSVTQRTHEIGVRMALGAGHGDILKLMLKQGGSLLMIGLLIGLAGAVVLTRIMSSLLYGVSATDPLIFAATSLILITVAMLSSYIPGRRAAKVDPMIALRGE
ncbi:MAG TPA: ABC transporter permease [Pyrinomonadaceae bacterium]|jgi:putative ABC transport system permease protein|nr:ABC transporter permease [Pyrinomonadaceae bacterium]